MKGVGQAPACPWRRMNRQDRTGRSARLPRAKCGGGRVAVSVAAIAARTSFTAVPRLAMAFRHAEASARKRASGADGRRKFAAGRKAQEIQCSLNSWRLAGADAFWAAWAVLAVHSRPVSPARLSSLWSELVAPAYSATDGGVDHALQVLRREKRGKPQDDPGQHGDGETDAAMAAIAHPHVQTANGKNITAARNMRVLCGNNAPTAPPSSTVAPTQVAICNGRGQRPRAHRHPRMARGSTSTIRAGFGATSPATVCQ